MNLTINGTEFKIEANEKAAMEYFKEQEAIQGKEITDTSMDHLEVDNVEKVLKLLRLVDCNFPQFEKVKGNDAKLFLSPT